MDFYAALTAWVTVALAVMALIAAVFAYLAWRAQAEELRTLNDQVTQQRELIAEQLPVLRGHRVELQASREQRERDADERRLIYVSRVFIREDTRRTGSTGIFYAYVRNTGDIPVYDVLMGLRHAEGSSSSLTSHPGPLGGDHEWEAEFRVGASRSVPPVFACFRDVNGTWWRIYATGMREEIDFLEDVKPLISQG